MNKLVLVVSVLGACSTDRPDPHVMAMCSDTSPPLNGSPSGHYTICERGCNGMLSAVGCKTKDARALQALAAGSAHDVSCDFVWDEDGQQGCCWPSGATGPIAPSTPVQFWECEDGTVGAAIDPK